MRLPFLIDVIDTKRSIQLNRRIHTNRRLSRGATAFGFSMRFSKAHTNIIGGNQILPSHILSNIYTHFLSGVERKWGSFRFCMVFASCFRYGGGIIKVRQPSFFVWDEFPGNNSRVNSYRIPVLDVLKPEAHGSGTKNNFLFCDLASKVTDKFGGTTKHYARSMFNAELLSSLAPLRDAYEEISQQITEYSNCGHISGYEFDLSYSAAMPPRFSEGVLFTALGLASSVFGVIVVFVSWFERCRRTDIIWGAL